jgi:hypothetical protein
MYFSFPSSELHTQITTLNNVSHGNSYEVSYRMRDEANLHSFYISAVAVFMLRLHYSPVRSLRYPSDGEAVWISTASWDVTAKRTSWLRQKLNLDRSSRDQPLYRAE